jgi:hypothetical protein
MIALEATWNARRDEWAFADLFCEVQIKTAEMSKIVAACCPNFALVAARAPHS